MAEWFLVLDLVLPASVLPQAAAVGLPRVTTPFPHVGAERRGREGVQPRERACVQPRERERPAARERAASRDEDGVSGAPPQGQSLSDFYSEKKKKIQSFSPLLRTRSTQASLPLRGASGANLRKGRKSLLEVEADEAAGGNVVPPKTLNYNTSSLLGHTEHHKLMNANAVRVSAGLPEINGVGLNEVKPTYVSKRV
ncbi:Hypothetical predicted protein [Xyrichtys novacula]|uniref:Uncharacterized protein n=1 Tax=Xyrichtys novacula TaxID=13765 RepID=A0AAV1GVD3_XYRNO|nr:Hypothetical predicted protein [Xyrichtys novacula]